MGQFAPWNTDIAQEIITGLVDKPGAALPILHEIQRVFGFVPREAVPMVAAALNITRAEMHGIVTFYHDFREAPPGRRVLQICRAEACQSMGANAISAGLLARLRIDWGETTSDGSLTVDAIYCLGLCACAPAALLDGEPLGRVSVESLVEAMA
jgi:formate dehydrogenase subunit gamma